MSSWASGYSKLLSGIPGTPLRARASCTNAFTTWICHTMVVELCLFIAFTNFLERNSFVKLGPAYIYIFNTFRNIWLLLGFAYWLCWAWTYSEIGWMVDHPIYVFLLFNKFPSNQDDKRVIWKAVCNGTLFTSEKISASRKSRIQNR